MTALLQAKNLGYSLGTKHLFQFLNVSVNLGDRIGLVGHNGAGKTSLLNLLAGQTQPDEGEVTSKRGLRVAMVEQFIAPQLRPQTLRQMVLQVLPTEEQFTYRADTVLDALGFNKAQLDTPVERLSGGQQNIALLARAQILEPDILLMDEPGNHMDVTALAALRGFLIDTKNLTYIMVSHDRDLLEDCCTRTVFLRDLTTYAFNLPYAAAKQALQQQDAQATRRLQVEEKEIGRIRKSAKRLAQWGKVYDNPDLARKAKTMDSRADKLESDKTFVTHGSGLELSLSVSSMRSKSVFTLENFEVVALDDARRLLTCEFLAARPGDRIALLGANGVGKSTTIKSLLSANADDSVRFNPNVKIGYVDQELESFAVPLSRYDWLAQRVDASEGEIKRALLHAGIAYKDIGQSVTTLSGGEKARMMFIALRLQKPNFVILDEPTNHIDLESREQLETQLQSSGITLLITSHDRRFLQAVCNRYWIINGGRLTELDSLDAYYNEMIGWRAAASSTGGVESDVVFEDDDAVLARIVELESLLQDDFARKPKFQKPHKHAHWQGEIERLWDRLNEGDLHE